MRFLLILYHGDNILSYVKLSYAMLYLCVGGCAGWIIDSLKYMERSICG